MNYFEAFILGIIQGLTEFIPISSTAHLTLFGKFLGLIDYTHPERWTSFISIIQLGTLLAVFAYFKKEIIEIPKAFVSENLKKISYKKQSTNSKLGWLIVIASFPIGIVGLLFKDFIEGSFTKELNTIGISLITLAIILYIAEKKARFRKDITQISVIDAILIGISQCLALIPGASRSGTTITGGLFCGINREDAARFSFLISIPAIGASGIMSFMDAIQYITYNEIASLIIATITSAISGYFAIDFLIKYLKNHNTNIFIFYRLLLGIAVLFIARYFEVIVL